MRRILIISAVLGGFAIGAALADVSINIAPEIDTWAMGYESPVVPYEGDIAVGGVLPGSVEFVEVPGYADYGYVNLNKRRVLVEKKTRKVVKIYK